MALFLGARLTIFLTDEEAGEYSMPGIQHLKCEEGTLYYAIFEL